MFAIIQGKNKMQTTTARAPSRSHIIYTIAVTGFIFALHIVVPMYSNSSYLSLFANERTLSFIYMTGGAATIFGFLVVPAFIRRVGNYRMTMYLILAQMALFYGLATSVEPLTITILFILQSTVAALIGLSLDIFLEVYTDSAHVGSVRGLYTATLNAAWVIGPLLGSMLINGSNDYRDTYVAALAMLFPLLYLVYRNFPRFKDPNYTHLSPWRLAKHITHNHNWVKLFSANLILQVFYAWMVVYSPIYLHLTLGFGWKEIGVILVVMLLPFPLIQYPLGRLADRKYGEKEMMVAGFAIMGVSTILLAFIKIPSVALWAFLLFATRVGAATVEIMMETYFFKTVSPRDAAALGVFRVTRPLSYFLAPLVTIVGLLFTTNEYLFAVIGVITLLALIPAATIRDTN